MTLTLSILEAGLILGGIAASLGTCLALCYRRLRIVSADITSHRAALRDLRSDYQTLTQNLAASVAIRSREGKISYCNSFTEVLTGYPLAEILSDTEDFFITIAHEKDKERVRRALRMSDIGEPYEFQFCFLDKAGFQRWAESRIVPIIKNGDICGSLSVTIDVTRSIRHQLKIEEKNRDLQDFTSMVSHDLKAPLYTIKGMAGILGEEMKDSLRGDAADALEHIVRASQKLEQLVAGVLEYSKIATTEIAQDTVPLDEVWNDVRNDYAHQIATTGAVIDVATPLPTVLGDRLRLYQILSNLIGNAIKYGKPNEAPKISVHVVNTSPRDVTLAIQDHGLGIPSSKLDTIFRPFQRAHTDVVPHVEGSGIGLACVKKLVERLGGEIKVQSTEGAGTTFTVSLRHG